MVSKCIDNSPFTGCFRVYVDSGVGGVGKNFNGALFPKTYRTFQNVNAALNITAEVGGYLHGIITGFIGHKVRVCSVVDRKSIEVPLVACEFIGHEKFTRQLTEFDRKGRTVNNLIC